MVLKKEEGERRRGSEIRNCSKNRNKTWIEEIMGKRKKEKE